MERFCFLNFNIFLRDVLSYLINSHDLLRVKDEWGAVQRGFARCSLYRFGFVRQDRQWLLIYLYAASVYPKRECPRLGLVAFQWLSLGVVGEITEMSGIKA